MKRHEAQAMRLLGTAAALQPRTGGGQLEQVPRESPQKKA